MRITGFIWIEEFAEPAFRFMERGNRVGEDVYGAFGQTEGGRYLSIFFVHKRTGEALVVSARPMTTRERRSYG